MLLTQSHRAVVGGACRALGKRVLLSQSRLGLPTSQPRRDTDNPSPAPSTPNIFSKYSGQVPTASDEYPRLDATATAKLTSPPRSCSMLVRDHVHDALYNPHYGYFSKQALIFSPSPYVFGTIRSTAHFQDLLAADYAQLEEELGEVDDVARQLWHTPTELFQPWYGYALAKYVLTEYKLHTYPTHDLHLYEMGGGNGTLALNILDWLRENDPYVYARTRYTIIEISPQLAARQRANNRSRPQAEQHACLSTIEEDVLQWKQPVPDPCFFLAMEVIDNFAHDIVRFDTTTGEPVQSVILTDSEGEYEEVYEPVTDPLITRYLRLRSQSRQSMRTGGSGGSHSWSTSPITTALHRLRSHLPYAPNLSTPEHIPTGSLRFLDTLSRHFPAHRLILSDFSSLPDAVPGVDAPVVQTRYKGTMVPCSTYLVQPGYFDIFYPTNFPLLADIYGRICRTEQPDGKVKVLSHADFLERWGDTRKTQVRSGENIMLDHYENCQFLLS
ncbi:S-adenosyl-L-methionine-dependent methyltransferase [Piptocephalis cylindrospora]|uniref:Protein arginine methyltransferase NDUFAF7 n=1 Tax=Piptocephalis cylindrospora TaxID=1907219 RepID=A0A4P9Y8Q6_9FUNG|nr:S-adenosyl-L-methionine-dependent methyltransferase [Piptocephalis cylindrospora]|eukprot:RKP15415.1 S-adenosyl-L-methionine-dependent methyltransferase [Piptocephalis cylindrospora]